ncbi:MAG: flagellar basal body rod protein FlgB [Spirochaetales bacterium]
MFENTSFGKTVAVLQRSLDVSSLRREVISNNIANADTPNFKRTTVNFEASLKKALDAEKVSPDLQAEVSDPRHMSFDTPTDWKSVGPTRVLDYLTQSKSNGNNVDLEEELMSAQQNQMMYTLMAQAAANEYNQINIVLRR